EQDVLFIFNAQHDCISGGCLATNTRPVRQERQDTTLFEQRIQHNDDDLYVINMHAIHNAAILRDSLPRALTAPRPYVQDRATLH
ncbi:hypothetical protein FA95DRAFT_1458150, partial [Auriscalpium vulgare]